MPGMVRTVHPARPRGLSAGVVTAIESVGVTSAASTPGDRVQDGVAFFRDRTPDVDVVEQGEPEEITFRPPKRGPSGSRT